MRARIVCGCGHARHASMFVCDDAAVGSALKRMEYCQHPSNHCGMCARGAAASKWRHDRARRVIFYIRILL